MSRRTFEVRTRSWKCGTVSKLVRPCDAGQDLDREAQERSNDSPRRCSARADYAAEIRNGQGGPARRCRVRLLNRRSRSATSSSGAGPATALLPLALGGNAAGRSACIRTSTCCSSSTAHSALPRTLVKALLHPLWDLGFTVGHQVRELSDFEHLDDSDPGFLLALSTRGRSPARRALQAVRKQLPRPGRERARWRSICFGPCWSGVTPSSTIRSISSSPTSRKRRAGCATSPPSTGSASCWEKAAASAMAGSTSAGCTSRASPAAGPSILHLQGGRNTNVLSHPLRGAHGGTPRVHGHAAAAARRASDGGTTFDTPGRSRGRRWSLDAARGTPTPTRTGPALGQPGAVKRGRGALRSARAASDPARGCWPSRRPGARLRACSDRALTGIHRSLNRFVRRRFRADAGGPAGMLMEISPRRGCTPGSPRCTTAGSGCASGVRADPLPGDPRLLPQVHGRRAHARSRCATSSRSSIRGRRARGSAAPARRSTRPSCSRWRCCCTTSASGKTRITRSKASA